MTRKAAIVISETMLLAFGIVISFIILASMGSMIFKDQSEESTNSALGSIAKSIAQDIDNIAAEAGSVAVVYELPKGMKVNVSVDYKQVKVKGDDIVQGAPFQALTHTRPYTLDKPRYICIVKNQDDMRISLSKDKCICNTNDDRCDPACILENYCDPKCNANNVFDNVCDRRCSRQADGICDADCFTNDKDKINELFDCMGAYEQDSNGIKKLKDNDRICDGDTHNIGDNICDMDCLNNGTSIWGTCDPDCNKYDKYLDGNRYYSQDGYCDLDCGYIENGDIKELFSDNICDLDCESTEGVIDPDCPSTCAEFLVYDGDRTFTETDDGFHYYYKLGRDPIPTTWPLDWTDPIDFWNGVLHVRIEVKSRPLNTDDKIIALVPTCIWMHDADGTSTTDDEFESCEKNHIFVSSPNVYEHTTKPLSEWWHKNGGANKIDISRPYDFKRLGLVMRGYIPTYNPNYCYVSPYDITDLPRCWYDTDPTPTTRKDYLPMEFHLTIVAVAKDATFSGWGNYIGGGGGGSSQAGFTHTVIDSSGTASAWGKGIGDINKDGKVDLLVGGTDGLYWYENPSWTKHTIDSSRDISTDIEVADINKDGQNDVVTIIRGGVGAIWYEKDGNSWIPHPIPPNVALHDIELADFDNDGDLDIVARNQGSLGDKLYFYRQDNPTSWSQSTLTLTHAGEGVKVADINKDGKPDVVVTRQWYKNTGSITGWQDYTYSSSVYTYGYIDTGDLNGDGRTDIVISPSEPGGAGTPKITWFESPANPENIWTEHVIENNVEPQHHFVGIGDFNKDGRQDVATATMEQSSEKKIKIYYNTDGNGAFGSPQTVADMSSHSIKVVDVNNDGFPDLYGADHGKSPTPINLWMNDGATGGGGGTASLDQWTYIQVDDQRPDQCAFGLTFGDMDGDGKKDIIAGREWYKNPGGDLTGAWTRTDFGLGDVDAMVVLDVDADSNADLIAEGPRSGTNVPVYWLEAANADATSWTQTHIGDIPADPADSRSQGYALGELASGGAGKPEIALSSVGIHYFQIPTNPKTDTWSKVQITDEAREEGIALGDIDRDGDLDVAGLVAPAGTTVAWWENPGNGAPSWTRHDLGTPTTIAGDRIAVADINGDSKLDVIVTETNNHAISEVNNA
ncbi:MAG: VCBS repeat-containing protein, partial [archaeon]